MVQGRCGQNVLFSCPWLSDSQKGLKAMSTHVTWRNAAGLTGNTVFRGFVIAAVGSGHFTWNVTWFI